MTYRTAHLDRTILGVAVRIEETRDGIQRSELITVDGALIGSIATDKWTPRVWGYIAGQDDSITRHIAKYEMTKDQAFADIRRQIVSAFKHTPVQA